MISFYISPKWTDSQTIALISISVVFFVSSVVSFLNPLIMVKGFTKSTKK